MPSRVLRLDAFSAFLFLAVLAGLALIGFADGRSRSLALNTLLLSGSVSLASLAAGAPLAMLLTRTDLPGRRNMLALLLTMLFVPLYLQTAAWQAAFGLQGWFSWKGGAALLEGWRGAICVHTAAAIPWAVAIVSLGLRQVERELEEQALLDAASPAVFFRVTLPRAAGSLLAAGLWIAVATAGDMTVTDVFQVRTYAEEVYTSIALGEDPAGPSGPAGALTTVLAGAAALVMIRKFASSEQLATPGSPLIFPLHKMGFTWAALCTGLCLVLVGVPLASLIYKAGMMITQGATGWSSEWSAVKCLRMVVTMPKIFNHELGWSFLIGALVATAAVLLSIPLAWGARGGPAAALPAWLLMVFCLAVPAPLVGLGVITIMNRPGVPLLTYLYDQSIAGLGVVQCVRALPITLLIVGYALRTFPEELLQIAATDGAGRGALLWRIIIPNRRSALTAAWLAALAVSLGELPASILVAPPGVTTLSIRIFGLIHYGVDDQVAGICLFVAAIFAALAGVVLWLLRRSELE